mgnify:CR=1 FL=1
MLENWIFLSLLAPLFWAFSNFVDKYLLGRYTKGIYDFLFFSSVVSWSWIFIIGLTIFVGLPELNEFSWIPIVTGIFLLYSYGFYGKALEKGDTSALVILFKLIPVVTVILAFVFLNQKLSANEWLGFVVVFAGAMIVSLEKIGSKGFIKGFWLILIAILMWAVITIMVDYGLQKITFWDYFILDVYQAVLLGGTADYKFGHYNYLIDRTTEKWDSWEEWYQKMVWYCNRRGAYLYGNKNPHKEIVGHH